MINDVLAKLHSKSIKSDETANSTVASSSSSFTKIVQTPKQKETETENLDDTASRESLDTQNPEVDEYMC